MQVAIDVCRVVFWAALGSALMFGFLSGCVVLAEVING